MKTRFAHCILTVLFISICCFLPRAGEAQAGSIIGTVVDDDGSSAVSNVQVAVYAVNDSTRILIEASTDTIGGYTLTGLINGGYRVRFITDATDYIEQWHAGSRDFNGAQLVSVASETPVDLGETRLILGGKITGTVTYNGTPPSTSVYMQAYGTDGWFRTAGVDSSTGGYTLTGLPAGSYTIRFWAFLTDYVTEWYNNISAQGSAVPVLVTQGATTSGINAQLTLGSEISGTVSYSDGSPVEGALVVVVDSLDSEEERGFAIATDGSYTVSGLPSDGSFKVQFFESVGSGSGSGMTQWYNNKSTFDTADIVTIGVGDPLDDAVLGSNFNWFLFVPVINFRP
jgi:hypothetical protein